MNVNLNGDKTYQTDANGQIKVSTKGLDPNAYTAKVTFNGNAKYLPTAKVVKVTVGEGLGDRECSRADNHS